MHAPLPIVLIPGLNCSARLYADQIPALWRFGPVQVADHTRDDSMDAIATRILADAPPRFALVGLSMGGFIAQTIIHQRPERIAKLALLDTSARPETPEQTARREPQIALAESGRFAEVPALQFPIFVHRNRQSDAALRQRVRTMAEETGAQVFLRQQNAIMTPPRCAASVAGDQMSDAGAGRRRRRVDPAAARAGTRRRNSRLAARGGTRLRAPLHHGAAGGGQRGAHSMVGTLK